MSKLRSFKKQSAKKYWTPHWQMETNEGVVRKAEWDENWIHAKSKVSDHHLRKLIDHAPSYNHDEMLAMNRAKTSTHSLNNHLVAHGPNFPPEKPPTFMQKLHGYTPKHLEEMHRHLSNAIQKTTAPHEFHVYTGLGKRRSAHVNSGIENGGVVHFPHFLSTSLNKRTPLTFTDVETKENHLLKIKIPKGAHHVALEPSLHEYYKQNPHGPISIGGEHEIMLHHGAKIRIHPGHHEINWGKIKIKLHHATLIHDGIKSHE